MPAEETKPRRAGGPLQRARVDFRKSQRPRTKPRAKGAEAATAWADDDMEECGASFEAMRKNGSSPPNENPEGYRFERS
jgi:hypothetical protein